MKQLVYSISLITTLIIALASCNEENTTIYLPEPTDTTYVKTDMEDGTHRDLKKYWFESIHSCSPETDWRLEERRTLLRKYNQSKVKAQSTTTSSKEISVDGGAFTGEWYEKGSINLSGSILKTAYNNEDKKLYVIADGGSMWKTDITDQKWEVVNQDLRFDGRFLDLAYPPGQDFRIVSSVGGLPHYLDANDDVWQLSAGLDTTQVHETKDQCASPDGQYVFYLSAPADEQNVRLYYSKDYGLSYELLKELRTKSLDDYALNTTDGIESLYLVEKINYISAAISRFDFQTEQLRSVVSSSPVSFGTIQAANLESGIVNGELFLYTYDLQNRFYKSNNLGVTWNIISQLPTTPWEAGIHVSRTNPNILMMGAVEAYRSINGGRTWAKVNEWHEYYSNQSTTLHADIMDIGEYETDEGVVTIISNHGGLSKSYDLGEDFINMGLGLNASQYYSVKTYPHDNDYVFAGSQDQGLQRALDLDEGPATFTQFISGDFGHLQFTNLGKSLWAIYPGGWISYYPDPIGGALTAEFELLTNNRSVWLPPIITSPYNPNSILIAGGSLLGTAGSHIVELTVDDLSQLFANQWPYNFQVGGGEVSAMGYNAVFKNQFYVLTTNGKFFKSTNEGSTFTPKDNGLSEAHHLYGNTILSSKNTPKNIIIGGSGYDNPAVYISDDFGESFVPMIDGLPPTSVFQMTYDKDEDYIFAATEAGPYVYSVAKKKWFDLAQSKAPNQRYWSVEYLEESNLVRYGTYGRGIWDLKINDASSGSEPILTKDFTVYPNPSNGIFKVKTTEKKGSITVRSATGKLVLIKDIDSNEAFNFDLTGFSNGLYYVIFDDGNIKSSSVIVKNMSESQLLGVGSRVKHPAYGEGVVISLDIAAYTIVFMTYGKKLVGKETDGLEIIECIPAEHDISFSGAEKSLIRILKTYNALGQTVELGDKWNDGTMILQPNDPSLKNKEFPIDTFFHKIVMVRDRLRVMEQRINSSKLTDEEKVNLQQYISRIYGSLTSFNILFKHKADNFKGEGRSTS